MRVFTTSRIIVIPWRFKAGFSDLLRHKKHPAATTMKTTALVVAMITEIMLSLSAGVFWFLSSSPPAQSTIPSSTFSSGMHLDSSSQKYSSSLHWDKWEQTISFSSLASVQSLAWLQRLLNFIHSPFSQVKWVELHLQTVWKIKIVTQELNTSLKNIFPEKHLHTYVVLRT